MTPLPVITDVYRVVLDWESGDACTPKNILHIRSTGNSEAGIGAALDASWQSGMWDEVSSDMAFSQVTITKLDGTSAAVIVNVDTQGGGAGGQIIPEQAMVLSLRTLQRGPRGRGRLFLGPVTEDNVNQGKLSVTPVNNIVVDWGTFNDQLHAQSPSCALVVASYVHSDAHDVTSISSSIDVGMQRRRLLRGRS
jgi:hypothetical protein